VQAPAGWRHPHIVSSCGVADFSSRSIDANYHLDNGHVQTAGLSMYRTAIWRLEPTDRPTVVAGDTDIPPDTLHGRFFLFLRAKAATAFSAS